MRKTTDLSIIVVNYNTRALIRACLLALSQSVRDGKEWEIIVVDNASVDGSTDELQALKSSTPLFRRALTIVQNKKNIGFAAANNKGIAQAQGKYILLLNSDTEVEEHTIVRMIDFMEHHPEAGVSTCKLMLPDGSIDPACHRGFPTPWAALTYFLGLERIFPHIPWFSQYHQWYKDFSRPHEIDSPSGAFFLVRREVIDQVGALDEDYFMYGEDIDWAYRIKKAKWKILFNPEVVALHRKKQSGRAHEDAVLREKITRHFYETMKLFYDKHYQHRYGSLVRWCVLLGIALKSKL